MRLKLYMAPVVKLMLMILSSLYTNNGEIEELLQTVQVLLHNNACVIGISRSDNSSLNKLCFYSYAISVNQERLPLNKAPRLSITAQLTLIQSISIILQSMNNLTLCQYKKIPLRGL